MYATNSKTRNNKWWAWLAGIVLIFLLAATIFRMFYLEPWLQKKLAATITERSQGLYTLTVKNVDVSLLSGALTLDSLSLEPDFKVWEKQKQKSKQQAASLVGSLKAGTFTLQGLNYVGLLLQKPLQLKHIILQKPNLVVYKMPVKPTPAKPMHQTVSGVFKNLGIGKISVNNGHFTYKNYQDKLNTLAFAFTDFQVKDVQLDSQAYNDPDRFYYAQEVKLQANKVDLLLPMAFYRLKVKQATFSTTARTIVFTQSRLVPLYSAAGMSRKMGSALTQFKLSTPQVKLAGVNFFNFARYGNIAIDSIKVLRPRLSAYEDALHFQDKITQPLPHQIIQKLKLGLTIHKVQVTDLDIRYRETSRKTGKDAMGTFENMNLVITNISNDKNRMSAKSPAVLWGNTLVMGKARLQATVRYNLLSPNGYHTIQGTIGNGQPEILNPILEQDQLIRVKSGTVQKGKFSMVLTDSRIKGTMQLHYENFKVDMLSKPKDNDPDKKPKQSLGKKILSLFANKAVLNTDNKPEENSFKVGEINTPHRKNRSIITYWIDGLTSGIRSSLGLSSKVPV